MATDPLEDDLKYYNKNRVPLRFNNASSNLTNFSIGEDVLEQSLIVIIQISNRN